MSRLSAMATIINQFNEVTRFIIIHYCPIKKAIQIHVLLQVGMVLVLLEVEAIAVVVRILIDDCL